MVFHRKRIKANLWLPLDWISLWTTWHSPLKKHWLITSFMWHATTTFCPREESVCKIKACAWEEVMNNSDAFPTVYNAAAEDWCLKGDVQMAWWWVEARILLWVFHMGAVSQGFWPFSTGVTRHRRELDGKCTSWDIDQHLYWILDLQGDDLAIESSCWTLFLF